jgi:hypothetical protein
MPDIPTPGGPDDMGGGEARITSAPERPIHERLKYKTVLHKKTIARLTSLRDLGREVIQNKVDDWNRADEHNQVHIDLTRSALKGDGTVKTTEKEIPFERSLVVPVSFAVEKTLLTQGMSLFSARDPMVQFDGAGPEDVAGAKLLETVGAYDLRRMRAPLVVGSAFQSALRYGIAPVHSFWNEDMGWTMKPLVEGPMAEILGAQYPELTRPIRQWGLRSAHVDWRPVDPYKLRLDPRKSASNFQRSDFIGHERVESLTFFTQRQLKNEDGPYFNVDQLKKTGFDTGDKNRSVGAEPGAEYKDYGDTASYRTEHLEVRLIPKEWKLGDSERAEIWWFEWCGDDVIVRAHRSPYHHGEFNYQIGEALPDMHTVINPGFGEIMDPLQRFMNWMASSHLENVRRFINNESIVSPAYIEMDDLLNPMPARFVRTTEEADELIREGAVSGVGSFFQQMPVQDMTKGHLQDITWMFDLVSRLSGVNDPVQGIQLPTRRTATEIETISGAASQRISYLVEILDEMLVGPLAEHLASIRQQFTTDTQWYRVAGDLAREIELRVGESDMIQSTEGGLRVKIAPWDLYGNYDYVPLSGNDPQNPAKSAESLIQLLEVMAPIPHLVDPQAAMMMGEEDVADLKEVVIRIGENLGIKDIKRLFKPLFDEQGMPLAPPPPPIGVVPDEEMAAMAAAGNAVPAGVVQ